VEYLKTLRRELPPSTEIWTALSVGRDPLVSRGGDRLLFDNERGGSGRPFDWSRVSGHPQLDRAILAGGIGPANARSAQALGAFAIDVGSAVDALPGLKSSAKIASLFEALRVPSRQGQSICA
jgi:indole-3-glycerol phosphate synthase/phosphoribosylanthranilate isomerase